MPGQKGGLLNVVEEYMRNKDKDSSKNKKTKQTKQKGGSGYAELVGSQIGSGSDAHLLLPADHPVEHPFSAEARGGAKRTNKKTKKGGSPMGDLAAPIDQPYTILMTEGGDVTNTGDFTANQDAAVQMGGKKKRQSKKDKKEKSGGSNTGFGGNLAYSAPADADTGILISGSVTPQYGGKNSKKDKKELKKGGDCSNFGGNLSNAANATDDSNTILMKPQAMSGGNKRKNNKKINGGGCGGTVSLYPPVDVLPTAANQYTAGNPYTTGDVYAPVIEESYLPISGGLQPIPNPPMQMGGGKKHKSTKGKKGGKNNTTPDFDQIMKQPGYFDKGLHPPMNPNEPPYLPVAPPAPPAPVRTESSGYISDANSHTGGSKKRKSKKNIVMKGGFDELSSLLSNLSGGK